MVDILKELNLEALKDKFVRKNNSRHNIKNVIS